MTNNSERGITFINPKSQSYLRQIENIILGLLQNSPPSFVLKNYHKWENIVFTDRITVKPDEVSERRIQFQHRQHRITFMVVVRLLAKIYRLLLRNTCVTRRELYYEEVQVIQCQRTVDAAIQIICHLLDCPPWDLNVMATSKGLAKGPLLIKTADNNIMDCSSPEGTLIPFAVCSPFVELRSSARYVLLVEKDAVFQRLIGENLFAKLENVLLITGKGFPDVNTRILVRKLSQDLKLPILALVDADPFGIAIMCTYRFGSLSMSRFSKFLATPDVKWLGIHPTDIDAHKLQTLKLNHADLVKLRFLEKLIKLSSVINKDLLKQVQFLLRKGRKAEIEAMSNISPTFLIDVYISGKIVQNDFF